MTGTILLSIFINEIDEPKNYFETSSGTYKGLIIMKMVALKVHVQRICIVIGVLIGILSLGNPVIAQEEKDSLDITTPFRKGRWLTGLSGSISSGANSLDTIGSGVTRNQYAIDLRTGKFLKDRLLLGGLVLLSRSSTKEFTKRTLETLYIGPLVTWYLTDDDKGSLFVSGSGGFVNFRDESGFIQSGIPSQILIDGNGAGILLRFGYSYVLHDRVAFDLSLNFTNSWLSPDVIE
jgi:hypothetical protein